MPLTLPWLHPEALAAVAAPTDASSWRRHATRRRCDAGDTGDAHGLPSRPAVRARQAHRSPAVARHQTRRCRRRHAWQRRQGSESRRSPLILARRKLERKKSPHATRRNLRPKCHSIWSLCASAFCSSSHGETGIIRCYSRPN